MEKSPIGSVYLDRQVSILHIHAYPGKMISFKLEIFSIVKWGEMTYLFSSLKLIMGLQPPSFFSTTNTLL